MLAPMLDGKKVTTVEGLAAGGKLDAIQVGFHAEHGLQCGFCTPGMMLVDVYKRQVRSTSATLHASSCSAACTPRSIAPREQRHEGHVRDQWS